MAVVGWLTVDDLAPFATIDAGKAEAMIADALSMAAMVAPCILDAGFAYEDAAKAIIRGAVLRWHDAGSGAVTQQTAGPFGQTLDTRQVRKGMFWPVEINQLAALCASATAGKAFEIDTKPATAGAYGVDYVWTTPTTTEAIL